MALVADNGKLEGTIVREDLIKEILGENKVQTKMQTT